jgi:metal-responsive CopG/Arc/MetJ family transcriptional regulator
MRHKLSVTIEKDLILKINEFMSKNRLFRSKSHVIEEALRDYFENDTRANRR